MRKLSIVRTIQDYDRFVTDTKIGHVADYSMPLDYVVQHLSNVRGHVVNMPLHYLEKEQLIAGGVNLSVNVVTGLLPSFSKTDFARGYLHVKVPIYGGRKIYRILISEGKKSCRNHVGM